MWTWVTKIVMKMVSYIVMIYNLRVFLKTNHCRIIEIREVISNNFLRTFLTALVTVLSQFLVQIGQPYVGMD